MMSNDLLSTKLTNILNLLNNKLLKELQEGNYNDEFNLKLFENMLNRTIPTKNEYKLYSFIKQLSSENEELFLVFLKNFNIEYYIFWAKLDVLLNYLQLSNKFYIKQNYIYFKKNKQTHKILNSYTVTKVEKEKKNISDILKDYDQKSVVKTQLDITEEDYFKEEDDLWERRRQLRNNIN